MAMGVTDAIILPLELSPACELVGNSIAEVHVLAALWFAVKGILHVEVDWNFADILRHFNQARLRASQVQFAMISGALVVHRTNEPYFPSLDMWQVASVQNQGPPVFGRCS